MSVAEKTKESTDLVSVKVLTPEVVFAPGGVDAVLGKIEAEVRSTATDISTPSGRAAVASLAYKVARSKTALDEMGKTLVAEWKAKANAVDAERRTIRDRLDALKDEVRQPLTEWENADKKRIDEHERMIAQINQAVIFDELEPTAAIIRERIKWLEGFAHNRDWQEFAKRAQESRDRAASTLASMAEGAEKREAERAELERLRQERAERERRERDERIRAEAAERARREAEEKAKQEAERAAAEAEKERQRIEAERRRAEQERSEAIARAEKAEADRKAAAAKAEEDRKRAAEAAERDRKEAIEAERRRVADEQAAAAEAAAQREANKRHRAKVNGEARDAIVAAGVTAEQATAVVTAIAKGEVPHVRISY